MKILTGLVSLFLATALGAQEVVFPPAYQDGSLRLMHRQQSFNTVGLFTAWGNVPVIIPNKQLAQPVIADIDCVCSAWPHTLRLGGSVVVDAIPSQDGECEYIDSMPPGCGEWIKPCAWDIYIDAGPIFQQGYPEWSVIRAGSEGGVVSRRQH